MSDDKKIKKQIEKIERITIIKVNLAKIDNLINQFKQKRKGLSISRKEFINWHLSKLSENLSAKYEVEIFNTYYDEERFLKETLSSFKKAKNRGENVSLQEMLSSIKSPAKSRKNKSSKVVESKKVASSSSDPIESEN